MAGGRFVISGVLTALLGAGAIARAQGSGAKTWDFQADALNAPPAGFSFGRTGQGLPTSTRSPLG